MVVLGDVFSKALSERVRARICSHVTTVYGSTENATTASAPAELIHETPDAVGFVVPGVTVEIVSDTGQALRPGTEGLVRIKSPYAVDRYMGDPAAAARTFRDGWFFPGDLGILDSHNLLRITGRHDSVLNLGGEKINSEAVERVLAGCAGVAECAAFSAPNELGVDTLWAAVVADAGTDDRKLQAHCAAILPAQFIPAGFIRVERLPRNHMGKIDRGDLHNLLNNK
jgi:acyl-coenzyme A synthetase/AMP-(fatty) acid ligase